jgi:hypothetical protein
VHVWRVVFLEPFRLAGQDSSAERLAHRHKRYDEKRCSLHRLVTDRGSW